MTIKMKMAVLVLSALVGISGLAWLSQSQISKVYEKANYGNENTIPSLAALNDAINMVATVRVLSWQHISQTEKSRRKELEDKIQSMRRKIDEALLKYEPLLSNEKDRSLLAADRSVLSEYDDLRDKVISLSNAGKSDEARDLLMANQKILTKLVDTFNDHGKFNIDLSTQAVTVASETRQSAAVFSLSLAAVTLLLIAGIGFIVSRSLLVQLGGDPTLAVNIANRIAAGDLSSEIFSLQGDTGSIFAALKRISTAVQALIKDSEILTKAAVEGKLSTRADATKHQGDYRKIVEGVNQTLDSVIGPLNVAADYVDKISRGAIPAKITDTYNGDFNTIKNNLNRCIDNVNAMVADAGMLARAAVEGKLSTRADATKHEGDFRKIVEGVNQTLDSVIGPLNVAADYVD
ncbi:MAG TPA: MCP four helix bundle domain-containing protein, partial [Leptospiraceae bacterium]|nr:MCP four helix bundle domain-containing protein [Leptospiraceae bacterium]